MRKHKRAEWILGIRDVLKLVIQLAATITAVLQVIQTLHHLAH